MMTQGKDPDTLLKKDKRVWLVGRNGRTPAQSTSTAASTDQDPYVEDITAKIRQNIEKELEAKVNKKVQENMAMMLKKLGEANPGMKLDIGNFCATVSSEEVGNGTPMTDGATS